jgi:hypothetical protein
MLRCVITKLLSYLFFCKRIELKYQTLTMYRRYPYKYYATWKSFVYHLHSKLQNTARMSNLMTGLLSSCYILCRIALQ